MNYREKLKFTFTSKEEKSAEDFYSSDIIKECRQNKNTYLLWYQGQQRYYWLPRENSRKLYRVDQGGMFNSIDDLEEKKYLLEKIRRMPRIANGFSKTLIYLFS